MKKTPPKHPNIADIIRALRKKDGKSTYAIILGMALGALSANGELDEPDPRITRLEAYLLRQAAAAATERRTPHLVKSKTPKE